MENQVVVSDYSQMDRVLREERQYIVNIIKQVKKSGCNVLLIQKSILRDAVNDLALHFLAKMKILVVKDIEREDIEFVCKVGCVALSCVCRFVWIVDYMALSLCLSVCLDGRLHRVVFVTVITHSYKYYTVTVLCMYLLLYCTCIICMLLYYTCICCCIIHTLYLLLYYTCVCRMWFFITVFLRRPCLQGPRN